MDWVGWDGMGWDLCAGLFYEHRFAMLIILHTEVLVSSCIHKNRARGNALSSPSPPPDAARVVLQRRFDRHNIRRCMTPDFRQ